MKIIYERGTMKNQKQTKTEKNKGGGGGTEVTVNGLELDDFVVHLS